MKKIKETRIRRSPELARQQILEAAKRQLLTGGLDAIRLQDVAREVGISHPAVLHHFGSREELVRSVVDHAVASLQNDLVQALAAHNDDSRNNDSGMGIQLFEQVYAVLSTQGHARLIAWLVLAGHSPPLAETIRAGWKQIVDITHAHRQHQENELAYLDTQFAVILSALTLFGEALVGENTFAMAGLTNDAEIGSTFRSWLATLLDKHLMEK